MGDFVAWLLPIFADWKHIGSKVVGAAIYGIGSGDNAGF